MGADSTRAPDGATTLTTKEVWDAAFGAWEAAKVAAAFAHAAYCTGCDEAGAVSASDPHTTAAFKKLANLAESTGTAQADAFKAAILTPAPDFAAVLWKMTALYGEGDTGPDDDHSAAWRMEYPGAVIADLERLQTEFAEAWLANWSADGGSVIALSDGTAQFSFRPYPDAPTYKPARTEAGEAAERQEECWNDGHYYGRMNARMRALTDLPGGAAMIRAHLVANGASVWHAAMGKHK